MQSLREYLEEKTDIAKDPEEKKVDKLIEKGDYKNTKMSEFAESIRSKIEKLAYSKDYKDALQDLVRLVNHDRTVKPEFGAQKIAKIYKNVNADELLVDFEKLVGDEIGNKIAFSEMIAEAAPPSREAKLWMISNKDEFKKEHGEGWEGALYATAWDMYNDGEFGDPDEIEDKGEDLDDDELSLNEKAPPSDEAEKWIEDNKDKFKQQYSDDEWEQVLYSTAWKLYNKGTFSESSVPSTTTSGVATNPQPVFRKEKNFGIDSIAVDAESFYNLVKKQKNKHWKRYLKDANSEFGNAIKKEYKKAKKLILKNSENGEMVFIK